MLRRTRLQPIFLSVCSMVKPIGKPDAGKPPAPPFHIEIIDEFRREGRRFVADFVAHASTITADRPAAGRSDRAARLLRARGRATKEVSEIDEILTVTRLGLPKELRRSLACTNIIENVMSTVRRVCRNVKRWRSASMAMRWTAAALQEAARVRVWMALTLPYACLSPVGDAPAPSHETTVFHYPSGRCAAT